MVKARPIQTPRGGPFRADNPYLEHTPPRGLAMEIPILINIAQEKNQVLKAPLLLHFTADQWKAVLASVRVSEVEPPKGLRIFFEAFRMPGDSEQVLGAITCPEPPCTGVYRFEYEGPGVPWMKVLMSCTCPTECHISFRFERIGPPGGHQIGRFEMTCVDAQGKDCRGYTIVFVKTHTGYRGFCGRIHS